jgi:hypothetical protein
VELLSAQLEGVANHAFGTLTAAAAFGLLVALWVRIPPWPRS